MWLEYVRALWPVVVGISLFFSGIVGLWLSSKFVAKPSLDAISTKLDAAKLIAADHSARLLHLEESFQSAPTRQELQDDISNLSARLSALEAGQRGIEAQLKTTNNYLHTLVENGLKAGGRK
jgi:Protein of unknown function (DUF2730)